MPFYPILPTPFLTLGALGATLSILLGLADYFVRNETISPTASRRTIHVLTGMVIFACRFIFEAPTFPLIAAGLFAGINLIAIPSDRLRGIHGVSRPTYGTVHFPVAFIVLASLFWYRDPVAMLLGIVLLTFADPLAGWIGQEWGEHPFVLWEDAKTKMGSVVMFLSTIIFGAVTIVCLHALTDQTNWPFLQGALGLMLLGTMVTIGEAASRSGSDNFTVPIIAAFFYALYNEAPPSDISALAVWAIGSAVVLGVATRLGSLSLSGMLTAWVIGNFIFMIGGATYILPIIAFFIFGSILSHLRPSGTIVDRPRRDLRQVFANGGVPLMIALVVGIFPEIAPHRIMFVLYLSSLAAASADTFATEIGRWSKSSPRDILSGQPVEPGTSGGITWLGSVGSIIGAGAIALIGLAVDRSLEPMDILLITLIGVGASLIDSLLGSTLQARYRLGDGSISEQRLGTDVMATDSGWSWLDNNMVNLVHSAIAAVAAGIILMARGG